MALSPALMAWRDAGSFHPYRDCQVFFRAGGDWQRSDQPVLLLLHGFPTASWDWSRVWESLCRTHRVLAPDFPGFGFSDKPPKRAYSIMDQADCIENFLVAQGVSETHLLAHDYGDTVAQELMARFAERQQRGADGARLLSVCLLNGGLFPETHRARLIQRLLGGPGGRVLARLMNRRGFGRQFSAIFGQTSQPSTEELDDFWQLIRYNNGHLVMSKLIGYMADRKRYRERWVAALQTDLPLRVINGPEDPVSGAHMAARLRQLVPEVDIVSLPGVGHYPQWEAPQAVCEAYLEFQKRLD